MEEAFRYLRYSNDGQSNYSIATQDMSTAAFCARHNLSIRDTYIDEGKSATTFDRPDFQRLYDYIKKNVGKAKVLVVHNLSRFSRDMGEAIVMVKEIQFKYGVRIASAVSGEIFDCRIETSFMRMGLEFLMSNVENIKRANDVAGGIYTAKAKEGRVINARPPFGYAKQGYGKSLTLIPSTGAEIVRFIYNSYLMDTPISVIRHGAKAMGFETHGNSVIQKILTNPLYCGFQKVAQWKDHPGGLYKANFEPIIDKATWDMVQEKMNDKKPRRQSPNEAFPLRGVLKCHCGRCVSGGLSTGKLKKKFPYYKCAVSGHLNLSTTKAHEKLETILQNLSIPDKLVSHIKRKSLELLDTQLSHNEALINEKKKELRDLDKTVDELELKYIKNTIDQEVYGKWTRKTKVRITEVSQEIDRLTAQPTGFDKLVQEEIHKLTDLRFVWRIMKLEDRQQLIRMVFDNSLYYYNNAFRTLFIEPIFSHNVMKMNEEGLLIYEGNQTLRSRLPLGGEKGNSIEHLYPILLLIKRAA